jgi:hypothetical protein
MERHSKGLKFAGFYVFFVFYIVMICGGYFIENKHITINKLASDNWSIVPLAQKISDSTLFLKDQFASNSAAVKQYIPAFVNSALYLTKFTSGDIFQAYNIFNFIVVVLHILLWFLVFLSLTRNHWLAFLFTMLMRGILWPPGNEIWGAGSLEYFLPRTVFAALLPLFFIALHQTWPHRKAWVPLAFLLLGCLGNFHPISGLGTGVASLFALFFSGWLSKEPSKKLAFTTIKTGAMLILGLTPFIWLYLSKDVSQAAKAYDKGLFSSLISERIGGAFLGPWHLYQSYLSPQWVFLILGSFLASFLLRKKTKLPLQLLRFLWLFSAFSLLMPLFFYAMQLSAHAVGFKFLNFSYELSRNSKYVIVSSFLLYGIAFDAVLQRVALKQQLRIPAVLSLLFITVSVLAKWPLQRLPGLKADFFRAQIPDAVTKTTYLPYTYEDLDSVFVFVKQHTPGTATFAGPPQLRAGALRSVPFDYKGASVLLEQNKPAYIQWALLNKRFEKITTDTGYLNFYKQLPVDYLVTNKVRSSTDSLLYERGTWRVYKLGPK